MEQGNIVSFRQNFKQENPLNRELPVQIGK